MLFLVYSLGMGVPFLVMALLIGRFKNGSPASPATAGGSPWLAAPWWPGLG